MIQSRAVGRTADTVAAGGEAFAKKLTTLILVSGNSFAVLAQVAILPVISSLTVHFSSRAHDGAVLSLLGYLVGPELASQLMITLLGIGIMVGGPAMGFLAERIGSPALLRLSMALFGGSGLGSLIVDGASALLVLRFVLGLAVAGISISCYSLTGARFEGEARARMLGYQSALVTVVGVLSLVGAGYLADLAGWRAPFALFLIAFPMFVIAAAAAWPRETLQASSVDRPSFSDLRSLLLFYVLLVPLNLAIFMTSAHIPFVLVSDGITDASQQSLILGSSFLMNLVTAFFYGRISRVVPGRWMFALLIAIFATSDLVIGFSRSWVGTMAGCWIGGWGGGLMMPLFVSIILARASEASRSRALGVMYVTMYVGDFLNPVLITPFRRHVGNHQVFAIVGMAMVLATVAYALMSRPSAGTRLNITQAVT